MPQSFATVSDANSETTTELHVIDADALAGWLDGQPADIADWVRLNGFQAKLGETLLVPATANGPARAIAGYGDADRRARTRFALAGAATNLPQGTYRIASGLPADEAEVESLGWLLSDYAFDKYRSRSERSVRLIAPEGINPRKVEIIAEGEVLLRDLVNTPTSDLGPDELHQVVADLAARHSAEFNAIVGDALLDQNFPMIHTVGRASASAPRLLDLRWGTSGPSLTLVGKGVCFDTGGLNLKPRTGMALMKKDMGGAANVLGLAHMIMSLGLDLRLRVLIPAVENSVSANSYRPGDILTSRKGLTVEINNTDAEGRLVLADAIAFATEENPDLMISMATLTGAARVALGADIAPFFTDDPAAAAILSESAAKVQDPVWRLPFHPAYESVIEPGIADLDNAPAGGFGGAITAALFLRRFAGATRYMHFDIYSWSATHQPARPKGGCGQGVRALLEAIPQLVKP